MRVKNRNKYILGLTLKFLILSFNGSGLNAQSFEEQTDIILPSLYSGNITWADKDMNGNLDILVSGSGISRLFYNGGNNYFYESIFTSFPGLYFPSAAWGDYDNDGDADLLLTGATSSSVSSYNPVSRLYRNEGGTIFSLQGSIALTGVHHSSVAWGDYDNDGFPDILLTGETGSYPDYLAVSKIYHNNGDDSFTELTNLELPGVYNGSSNWGDFDNDGDLDFILSGTTSTGTITKLFRNDGNNIFNEIPLSVSTYYGKGGHASWGDYDSDGYPDILLHGRGMGVYRNNGNGTFSSLYLKSNLYYSSAAWGDYDNDGDLDILVTGSQDLNPPYDSPFSTIYTNKGNGTFTEQTGLSLIAVDHSASSWADYDNDGDLDIVLSGASGSGNISALYRNLSVNINNKPAKPSGLEFEINNQDVIFKWNPVQTDETPSAALTYNMRIGKTSGGTGYVSPLALNTGKSLLASMGNAQLDTFFIYRGLRWDTDYYASVQAIDNSFTGGQFSDEVIAHIDPVQPSGLRARVINNTSILLNWKRGNGDRCIVFAREGTTGTATPVNNNTYYYNPVFGEGSPIGTTGWYCIYKGIADSVMLTGINPGTSYIIHAIEFQGNIGSENYATEITNENTGVFSTDLLIDQDNIITEPVRLGSAGWGDYNKDGYLDILVTGLNQYYQKITSIYTNNGDNSFSKLTETSLTAIEGGNAVWGDYDNDGDLDILIAGDKGATELPGIYKNENGNFIGQTDITVPRIYYGKTSWIDYDCDGDLDFLLTGDSSSGLKADIYRNEGGNNFTLQDHINFEGIVDGSFDWADYNNDGYPDLLLTGYADSGPFSAVYTNTGQNNFTKEESILLPQLNYSSVKWFDMNNDGYKDILMTGRDASYNVFTSVFINNRSGNFNELTNIELDGLSMSSAACGDMNNDGFCDIIITGSDRFDDRFGKIYLNQGGASFSEEASINIPGLIFGSLELGDYDNDGDLDILASGQSDYNEYDGAFTRILRNNIVMSPLKPNVPPDPPHGHGNTITPERTELSWQAVTGDETLPESMTYNLRFRSIDSANWLGSSMASDEGFRRLPGIGNTGQNMSYYLENLSSGTYCWQVQAVDQGFLGGQWSESDTFTIRNTRAFFDTDTVCEGMGTTFTDRSQSADGIVSWLWDFGDGNESSEQHPGHVYPAGGSYTVKLIVSSGTGESDSTQQDVFVKSSPFVSFTATNVCEGNSTLLSNNTDKNGLIIDTWFWDFGDGGNSLQEDPASHTYSLKGSYNIELKAIASNGCRDSSSNIAIVAAIPGNQTSVDGATSFCSGDSVIISAEYNPQYSYQWQIDGKVLTTADSSSIMVRENTGAYSVQITNTIAACVANSSPVIVTVNPVPDAPYITAGGPTEFCDNDSVILSVSNTPEISYLWKLNGGSTGQDINYHVARVPGTYSLVLSNSNSCTSGSVNEIEIKVNDNPQIPTVNISGPTTFCEGENVSLSTVNNPSLDYQWKNGQANITGADSNSYTPVISGNYSLVVTASTGCQGRTEPVAINIMSLPSQPAISLSGPGEFCTGDSLILSASNDPGLTYQWLLNDGKTGEDKNTLTVKTPGSYKLKLVNENGCEALSSNTVEVITIASPPVPTLSLSGPTVFCLGDYVDLSVNFDPMLFYRWMKDDNYIAGANLNSYRAEVTGSYKLDITNSTGCTSVTEAIPVIADPSPESPHIMVSDPTDICSGDSVELSVTNNPNLSFIWRLNGGIIGGNKNIHHAKISGIYSLEVINLGGCGIGAINDVLVTVNPAPGVPVVNLSGPTSFCRGESLTLSISEPGSDSYQWLTELGEIYGETEPVIEIQETGKYRLRVRNQNLCEVYSPEFDVTVNEFPEIPEIKSENYIEGGCPPDGPVTLKVEDPGTGLSFQWKRNGTNISQAVSGTYSDYLGEAEYTVETTRNGCSVESESFTISYMDLPPKPQIIAEGPVVWYLACSNDSANYYQWKLDEIIINGANEYIFVVNRDIGSYKVGISNTGECFTWSDPIRIPIQTGMTSPAFHNLKLYPNPANSRVSMELYNTITGELLIEIVGISGKLVLNSKFIKDSSHFQTQIDTKNLSPGIYFLRIRLGEYQHIEKLIIN